MRLAANRLPVPGDIYSARIRVLYAGQEVYIAAHTTVLIYDVREVDPIGADGNRIWSEIGGQGLHILWQEYHDRVLSNQPQWSLLDTHNLTDHSGQAPLLGLESAFPLHRMIELKDPVSFYEPTDPRANSLAVLRDEAIRSIGRVQESRGSEAAQRLTETTEAYNAAKVELEVRQRDLYEAVKDARTGDDPMKVGDISRIAGITTARVSQIVSGQ